MTAQERLQRAFDNKEPLTRAQFERLWHDAYNEAMWGLLGNLSVKAFLWVCVAITISACYLSRG